MQIGYIGLGKMGLNMTLSLMKNGHKVFAFDRNPTSRSKAKRAGAETFASIKELIQGLKRPRVIWLMVTHTAVDSVLREVLKYGSRDDTVIDGGNSFYLDSIRRHKRLAIRGVRFLDVGVSGGPAGAKNGACLMVGGRFKDYKRLKPLFRDLTVPHGEAYVGKAGAGHFVKMVHNGIEYGMMQALAEGFAVLRAAELRGLHPEPSRQGGRYGAGADKRGKLRYKYDLKKIADLYNHGSVIESRLVGWLENAFKEYGQNLRDVSGTVAHTGEAEWTVRAAKKLGVPAAVIKTSFDFRVRSKKNPSYTGKILSALRNQFGGHKAK